ncbi:hypothetical protein LMG19145_00516 [Xanthomonas arboricola pv. fragariae]|nr:hypothetical protein LMG19145_00516 [Xanthomonas arboricola pv. fragariae]
MHVDTVRAANRLREPLASAQRRSAPGRDWGILGEAPSRPGALLRSHGVCVAMQAPIRHGRVRESLAASVPGRSAPGCDWGIPGEAHSRPGALLRGHGVCVAMQAPVRHGRVREPLAASVPGRSAPGRDWGVPDKASSHPGALLRVMMGSAWPRTTSCGIHDCPQKTPPFGGVLFCCNSRVAWIRNPCRPCRPCHRRPASPARPSSVHRPPWLRW